MLDPYIESILIFSGINVILALSLYLPVSAGLLSLGQGGFMAIGAYVSGYMTSVLGWPFAVALIAGGVSAGLLTKLSRRSRAAGVVRSRGLVCRQVADRDSRGQHARQRTEVRRVLRRSGERRD